MATETEQDLEINQFRGVNRYTKGTVTPENEFDTIQNMFVPNEGELQSLGGISANSATLTGSPLRQFYLNPNFHAPKGLQITDVYSRGQIAFYLTPWTGLNSANFPSAPTGVTFTKQGSGSNIRKVRVVFVLPGGQETYTEYTGVDFGIGGTNATLPTNTPASCFCVNFYAEIIAGGVTGGFIWTASLSRVNGSFPASVNLPDPVVSGNADNTVYACTPTSVTFTAGTSGNLPGGRTYYFGITPWIGQGGSVVSFQDSSNRLMAFTLPADKSSITVQFTGLPAKTGDGTTADYTGVVIFMGTTPYDMLPIYYTSGAGTRRPFAKGDASSGVLVTSLPIHSNLAPNTDQIEFDSGTGLYNFTFEEVAGNAAGLPQGSLILTRNSATFESSPPSLVKYAGMGAFFIPDVNAQAGWGDEDRIEILPNLDLYTVTTSSWNQTLAGGTPLPDRFTFWTTDRTLPVAGAKQTCAINGSQFGPIMAFVDGFNTPFVSNGIIARPIFKADGKQYLPIVANCITYQNRLVLGGGGANFLYTPGYVFYSEPAAISDFGTGNNFPVIANETSEVEGFAIYGQNLISSGLNTFLVIGKKTSAFLWNGKTGSDQLVQQLEKSVGFASPWSVVQTKYGPVYVGYDNVYLIASQTDVIPIGFEFQSLLLGLSDAQRALLKCSWHEDHLKISWPSDPTGSSWLYDSEIWVKLRQDGGVLKRYWSGPHLYGTAGFNDVVVCQIWEPSGESGRDLRFGCQGNILTKLDDQASGTFLGSDIARKVIVNRLGLKADHYRKLLNRVYLAVQIEQDEDFDISITTEDGTAGTYTMTMPAEYSSVPKKFLQKYLTERILSRVTSLTVENTSDLPVSLFDISLVFKVLRRRKIT